jgi:hypothetical protein
MNSIKYKLNYKVMQTFLLSKLYQPLLIGDRKELLVLSEIKEVVLAAMHSLLLQLFQQLGQLSMDHSMTYLHNKELIVLIWARMEIWVAVVDGWILFSLMPKRLQLQLNHLIHIRDIKPNVLLHLEL